MKTSTDTPTPLERFALSGATMGTRYSAVFHAPQCLDTAALELALFAAVDRVDRQMSTWKPDSDLNRLNGAPTGEWIDIPGELGTVLAEGLRIGRITGGAFDMGVGDLVAANGFGAQAGKCAPEAQRARSDGRRVLAMSMLELTPNHRRARRTGPVALDLSGIAKGFAVDALGRTLDQAGIHHWIVGIDGEMRARGTRPDGTPWAIALERPEAGIRAAMGVLAITDRAVATSGDYRQFQGAATECISHTMDPRRGMPVRDSFASVTVLAETCMEADALATAFLVMGKDAGPKMAQVLGIEAIFVCKSGHVLTNLTA